MIASSSPSSFTILAGTVEALTRWYGVRLRSRLRRGERLPAATQKSMLLISWWLPPTVSQGTHRPASFLRYSTANGWRADVIAGPAPAQPTDAGEHLARSMPPSMRAHRVAPASLQTSWRAVPRLHDDAFVDGLFLAGAGMSSVIERRPDVVVASGPPFSTFIAARYLADYFDVPLVLDYRDLWSQCQLGYYNKGVAFQAWEAWCLARAQAVLFTTQSQMRLQLDAFDVLAAERCHLLENGWEPGDVPSLTAPRPRQGEQVDLVFVGTMQGYSSPLSFLDVLCEVLKRRDDLRARVRVRLVGGASARLEDTFVQHECRDVIDRVNHVSKPLAFDHMRNSTALLTFAGAGTAVYRPGKIYDYVAAGQPIIVYGHRGETTELVDELACGRFVQEGDATGLERALEETVAGTLPRGSQGAREAWLASRTREALAKRFFEILDTVKGKARRPSAA